MYIYFDNNTLKISNENENKNNKTIITFIKIDNKYTCTLILPKISDIKNYKSDSPKKEVDEDLQLIYNITNKDMLTSLFVKAHHISNDINNDFIQYNLITYMSVVIRLINNYSSRSIINICRSFNCFAMVYI